MMNLGTHARLGSIVAAGFVVSLAGCAMVGSTQISEFRSEVSCREDAGAYFLSKGVIRVRVTPPEGESREQPSGNLVLNAVEVHAVPDRRHGYCLNFRTSPVHNERLTVRKTKGILQEISSFAEDKTPEIANTLVETVFAGLSGDRSFRTRAVGGIFVQPFKADFDPFDEMETAVLNDSLNDLGFCLLLQEADWVIDMGYFKVGEYCENPLGFLAKYRGAKRTSSRSRENAILASQYYRRAPTISPVDSSLGILYRPRLNYTLMVYVKSNINAKYVSPMHEGEVRWNLRKQKAVPLENKSPILAIGVDRTFFATRKTVLKFNAGALVDVDIEKGSELAGFVKIPLTVADAIIKLPTAIFKVRIDNTKNRAELIETQTELIGLVNERGRLAKELAEAQQAQALTRSISGRALGADRNRALPRSLAGRMSSSVSTQAYTFASEAACHSNLCNGTGSATPACKDRCRCIVNQCRLARLGRSACDRICEVR